MQQGDIGAPIRFLLVDGTAPFPGLDEEAVVELWIRQPSGRILTRTMTITDYAGAAVYYETVAGDLAEHGRYRFQTRALLATGERVGFAPVDDDVGRNVFPATVYVLPEPARLDLRALEVART